MELNWSTFVLEILNFLVLVWILKRFLYQPVLEIIARRRAGIEQRLQEATALQDNAASLQRKYEGRLAEWEAERTRARETLARDLEQERKTRLAEITAAIAQEREKARVGEARRQEDLLHRYTQTALAQGARFASRLLERASGPDTEARLIELFIEELEQLPADQRTALRAAQAAPAAPVLVHTAYALPEATRQRLAAALAALCGADAALQFGQDSALLAGVRVTVGAWILGASVRDELNGFVELSRAE